MLQMGGPRMQSHEPTLRERGGSAIYDLAKMLGLRQQANAMRNETMAAMDFIPGVGAYMAGEEGARAFGAGDYLGASLAALGMIPGSGKAGEKAVETVAEPLAARLARSEAMGYSPQPFFRGEASGRLPQSYPGGAHFSADEVYARGFADKGGLSEPREFRLKMDRAFSDDAPVTADQYARLIRSAADRDPKLAGDLTELISPDGKRDVPKLLNLLDRLKDRTVIDRGVALRPVIEKSSDPVGVWKGAGFDALSSGRDVHKLGGHGIRSRDAVFDPSRADDIDIMSSLAGVSSFA
jgi:hypothetical protein